MLPQQQQPVASIGSGWPYGTKRPSYSKGTNVFLPGTQNRSGAIIPSTAVLMLCHPSSAPDKTMLTVFDGLDVAAEYKNLVRAGAPDVEAALPWDKPPGTLYLHLAQGEEFTSSKGQCSKCKVQTKAGRWGKGGLKMHNPDGAYVVCVSSVRQLPALVNVELLHAGHMLVLGDRTCRQNADAASTHDHCN